MANDFVPQIGMGIRGFLFWQYRPETLGLESPAWGVTQLDGSVGSIGRAAKTFISKLDCIKDELMKIGAPKAEIAICRKNFIYAEMVLNEARQKLMLAEAAAEGRKLHQFKAYDTLNAAFLAAVRETYPRDLTAEELGDAWNRLLSRYTRLVEDRGLCPIPESQFQIINCFD